MNVSETACCLKLDVIVLPPCYLVRGQLVSRTWAFREHDNFSTDFFIFQIQIQIYFHNSFKKQTQLHKNTSNIACKLDKVKSHNKKLHIYLRKKT